MIQGHPMSIKMKQTSRGFVLGQFKDMGGLSCSIQESSRADKTAIWLGVDDVRPMVMHSDARAVGIETDATCGWVPYPIPEQVLLHSRMELDQKKAKALIEALQRFVDTGLL
jgi:hypothetical protein